MGTQNCIGSIGQPRLDFRTASWTAWLRTGAWLARREIRQIRQLPLIWLHRIRVRREMAMFDARMIADIGTSEFDIQREVDKPFWRE